MRNHDNEEAGHAFDSSLSWCCSVSEIHLQSALYSHPTQTWFCFWFISSLNYLKVPYFELVEEINYLRDISISQCYETIGPERAKALFGFHALTGCDQTGRFNRKTKEFWWKQFCAAGLDVVETIAELGISHFQYIYKNLILQMIPKIFNFLLQFCFRSTTFHTIFRL